MRRVAMVLLLGACEFSASPAGVIVDAPMSDADPDAPDAPEPPRRVRAGLVALWTFDEGPGSRTAADSSGKPSVPLEVIQTGDNIAPAVFDGGDLVATAPGRVFSAESSRLAADATAGGGVTLEAWVMPSKVQGNTSEPAIVAGLTASVVARNIALLQAGSSWVGLVRTSAGDAEGGPRLTSTAPLSTSTWTHLVLVADGTRRALYVDNEAFPDGTPAAPVSWNPSYPMVLFDEYQHGRQWTGRIALVALYDRALTVQEIEQNWVLGAAAP